MKIDLINDHAIRARFLKDYSLPFNVVQDPYFRYFLALFQEDYGTLEALAYLEGLLDVCYIPNDFFRRGEAIKNEIIAKITATEAYSKFTSSPLTEFEITTQNPPSRDLYIPENSGQEFVSIDLMEANFNSMKFFSNEMFADFHYANYFIEVLKMVTPHNYFFHSKRFRQVIFGDLNPKRQKKIQRWGISKIIHRLLTEYLMNPNDIVTISDDEVIVKKGGLPTDIFFDLRVWCPLPLHIRPFRLERIGDHPYYIVRDNEGKMEIKGVPSYLMPQVYKRVKGLPIEEADRTFFFEGQLVRFVENFE